MEVYGMTNVFNYQYSIFGNFSGIITNIHFEGGCDGNLKAVSKLCEGMTADKINKILSGNTCGAKSTSCADQLAKAVMED